MSLHDAIHDGLKSVYTADTGSGGFNASSGNARVQFWERYDDVGHSLDRIKGYPTVLTEVVGESMRDPFGSLTAMCVVRVHLLTRRDPSPVVQSAIVLRLRTTNGLRDRVLDTANGWTFGPIKVLRQVKGPASGAHLHTVVEFQVGASGA